MKFLNSLKSKIILFSVALVIFSLLTTMLIVKRKAEAELSAALDNNAVNLLETIKLNIQTEYDNIHNFNASIVERRKKELQNNIEILHSTLKQIHEKVMRGELHNQEAKQLATDILNNIKFDDGIGYFWVTNREKPFPKMISHSFLPELNGKILDDTVYNAVLGSNKNLFVEMVDITTKKKQGFVRYLWPKPGDPPISGRKSKLSFVKLFEPWDWIIGSGVYMDDIEVKTNQRISRVVEQLNKTIAKRMVSESGYCFIFGEDNFMYVHPYLANRSGENLINPTTSNKILNDIKKAYYSGGKYMEYMWNRIDDRENFIYPKRVFINKFEPLGWYICVSVYKYDFDHKVRKLTNSIMFNTLLFIVIALGLSLLISRSITKPLKLLIDRIKITDSSGLPEKLTLKTTTREINTLKNTINNMIVSIEKYRTEIREERDFSMGIINGSPDIICGLKNDGRITFINPAGVKLTGYEEQKLYEKKLWDLLDETDESRIADIKNKILHQNQRNLEIKIKTKSGKPLTLLWNSIPFFQHNRQNIDIFGNCINISDRKKAENKLRFFQNYLSNIINSMPSSIIGIDATGKITQINDNAKKFFRLSNQKIIGRDIFTLLPYLDLSQQMIANIIRDRKPKQIQKNNLSLFDKSFFLEITIYPLEDQNRTGAVIRIDDISERIKLEEMMIQSEKMMSVGGLAAGMAHEINNPIAGMLQNAMVIKNKFSRDLPNNFAVAKKLDLDLEKVQQYIQERNITKHLDLINSAGVRAAEIITNMLSFARKSESKFKYMKMPVIIDNTLEILKTDYNMKKKYDFMKINIIKNYAEDQPKIKCEETKIQQVFMNILKNGAEAMMSGDRNTAPTFIINVFSKDGNIYIEFENNGPPIPPEIRKRIFEPFFTTKRTWSGTGLGLSVSYFIIARNHNGEMWVESKKNNNTAFVIELPIEKKND